MGRLAGQRRVAQTLVANATTLGSLTIAGACIVNAGFGCNGDASIGGTSTAQGGHVGFPPNLPDTSHDTAPLTSTAGRCYAFFVGNAEKSIASLYVGAYLGTAAVAGAGGAAVNWAEIGIATGTLETDANGALTDLTIRGYASIDTEARAGVASYAEKQITGLNIAPGTGLWVVVAASYETTQAGFRAFDGVQPNTGRYRAACQPSLNVGVALAFTDAAYSVLIPGMRRKVL